jgi:hypothetical protein
VSTLREIAADHARKAQILEAESARRDALLSAVSHDLPTASFLAIEQIPPHTLVGITENLPGRQPGI